MPDWIDDFMDATARKRSPASFRLWTAIGTIAAALERRVWTHTFIDPLYPNLYTILCGNPASGKSIMINEARKLLAPIDRLFLGPDAPTPESFLDRLELSVRTSMNGSGSSLFSAMTVLCREFGNLFPTYNDAFFATLTDLYDNPNIYTAPRRTSKDTTIESPTVNILAAATPDAIGKFPEVAWGEGFTSRVIFIYGVLPFEEVDILQRQDVKPLDDLRGRLNDFHKEMHGEFEWEDAARAALNKWGNVDRLAPIPTYSRLVHYAGRRLAHTIKLAMISSVSAGHGLTVTLEDFVRGRKWLLDAETTMPDVFRAMSAKSDVQLVQDLHHVMYAEYSKVDIDKRKPIEESWIYSYMENRTTSDKIKGIIELAEKSGRIRRSAFKGQWVPNAYDFT